MDRDGILKSIKSNLKGLVITEKNGYTPKKLREHYKEFIGQDLEKVSGNLGYSSMEGMLDNMKDLMRRSYNRDGEKVYIGVPDEKTRHMADIIGKTPAPKKKKKGTKSKQLGATAQGRSGGKIAQGKTCSSTAPQKDDVSRKSLEQFFLKNKLGSVPFKISPFGTKFMATVQVKTDAFKTYPKTFATENEAIEAVSELCVRKLNILKDGSVMMVSKDVDIAVDRIKALVAQMPNGVYSTVIEKQYEKKYKEQLPKLWWKKLEGRNVIKVEPLNQEDMIMIIYPPEIEDKCSNQEERESLFHCNAGMRTIKEDLSKLTLSDDQKNEVLNKLSDVTPPNGPYWDVYVTIVKSFQEIFVRFIGAEYSDKFHEVSQDMDNYYDDSNVPRIKDVVLEEIYAAQVDGEWHRVKVLDVEDGVAYCRFLDHGDEDFVNVKDLKKMHSKFLVISSQAFSLSLHGLEEVDEDEDVIERLEERITGKSFIAQVMTAGENGSPPSIILFDTSNEAEINLNEWIIHQLKSKMLYKTSSSIIAEKKLDKDENGNIREPLSDLETSQIPEVGKYFAVKVVWTTTPDNFVVQPLDSIHQLEKQMDEMSKFYNDPSNLSQVPANSICEGDILAARHGNGLWYRAKVTSVQHIRSVSVVVVRYVDYGEVHVTNLGHLQPLAQEFRRLPMQGVRAKLAGASPSGKDWTEEEVGWFHGRVVGKEFISRVGRVDGQVGGEKKVPLVLIDDSSPTKEYKYVVKELFDRKYKNLEV